MILTVRVLSDLEEHLIPLLETVSKAKEESIENKNIVNDTKHYQHMIRRYYKELKKFIKNNGLQ